MGSGIGVLTESTKRDLTMGSLINRTVSVDAFNVIYQFLHAIRGSDGKPLMNYGGDITSHLSGLFYRNLKLLEHDIRPIYCFDGNEKITKLRWYRQKNKDLIHITDKVIESGKELLDLMGIQSIQSPSEGDAQCAYLTMKDQAFCACSQDFDILLFGGKRLVRNLAMKADKIEFISLAKVLNDKRLKREDLISIAILSGNDYFSGIKGVGVNTAVKAVTEYDDIFKAPFIDKAMIECKTGKMLKNGEFFDLYHRLMGMYLNPNVNTNYKLTRKKPDFEKLFEFLYEKNGFSRVRVENGIGKLRKLSVNEKQTTLFEF